MGCSNSYRWSGPSTALLRPLVGAGTSCRSSGGIPGVQRPRRVRVSRRKWLYSNPGICAVVFPMCPSCLGIGRPFAGPVERLRIDCGSVVSPGPTNRNSSSEGDLPWSGRCGTHLSPNAQVAKLHSASACDVLWQSRVRRSSRLRDAISTQNG